MAAKKDLQRVFDTSERSDLFFGGRILQSIVKFCADFLRQEGI